MNDDGKRVDSAKANSYIIVKKLSDTSWLMQNYDMKNRIMQAGTYKDQNLQIPDGKFVYYDRLNTYNMSKAVLKVGKVDTANYLRTYGEFKNGKKNGWWVDYVRNGNKQREEYYQNGILEGPCRTYNFDTNTLMISGNYMNNQREGEWDTYDSKGEVISKEMYYHSRVYQRNDSVPSYSPPKPTAVFNAYMDRAIKKATDEQNVDKIFIAFTITPEGKVAYARSLGTPYKENDFLQKLLVIVKNSPPWKPANRGDESKPMLGVAEISVAITNGIVETKVLPETIRFFNPSR